MSNYNATLAHTPAVGTMTNRNNASGTICFARRRDELQHYKLNYDDMIYIDVDGEAPYKLSATITRLRDEYSNQTCGAPFDHRNSTAERYYNGPFWYQLVLSTNSFNYTPSQWETYGIERITVGDSIQFHATELNRTDENGEFRSYPSVNYTLVASQEEAGLWSGQESAGVRTAGIPSLGLGSGSGSGMGMSIKSAALLGLALVGAFTM